MEIGLINELHGRPGTEKHPTWESLAERAGVAEDIGFDVFVFEDALMYRGDEATDGVWESMTMAGALAARTSKMRIGQSVINAVYRSPAMTASMAETLHEISGGRYEFGIGAGNTPDSDYVGFGFPTDFRYSRFEEAIEIIHSLLKTGHADFDGRFHSARNAELVLRGPGEMGPPITIAAGGDKMLRLAARYGDVWNWWVWGWDREATADSLGPMVHTLEVESREAGRDEGALRRCLDVYTVVPEEFSGTEVPNMESPLTGSSQQIAEELLSLERFGVSEVRCSVYPSSNEALEAMKPVVDLVHRG